uniref:Uncharacterized protein n=1 Tax=Riboviria sp. TaxID=2585031 RepID=A0A8K1WSP7_9VIRU|nr:MAG: hypothetical protein 2 [Riboviria sp.]
MSLLIVVRGSRTILHTPPTETGCAWQNSIRSNTSTGASRVSLKPKSSIQPSNWSKLARSDFSTIRTQSSPLLASRALIPLDSTYDKTMADMRMQFPSPVFMSPDIRQPSTSYSTFHPSTKPTPWLLSCQLSSRASSPDLNTPLYTECSHSNAARDTCWSNRVASSPTATGLVKLSQLPRRAPATPTAFNPFNMTG